FRLRADPAQWFWGLKFLRECTRPRMRRNIRQLVTLGLYSRASLQALRAETGIHYDEQTRGILHFYTSEREYADAHDSAHLRCEYGCDIEMVSAARCVEIEPALRRVRLVGGSYSASDESGDAHTFTQEVARLAAERGVRFRVGRIKSPVADGG